MYNNETKLYDGYIYCIVNLVTGKRYVGQTTVNIPTRWSAHCSDARNGVDTYLYRSIRQYGIEAFEVSMLTLVSKQTKDELRRELNRLEAAYIDELNTLHPSGYNLTRGGQVFSAPSSKVVFVVDIHGSIINRFDSIRTAAEQTGVDEKSIQHACGSKSHYGKGFFWYHDDGVMNVGGNIGPQARGANNWKGHRKGQKTKRKAKPVHRFSLNGEYIDSFESAMDAESKTGIRNSGIYLCCNGVNGHKTAGGYRWSFNM